MMDSDAPMTSPAELSSQNEVARRLLTLARQLLYQAKPSQALQAVIKSCFLYQLMLSVESLYVFVLV